LFPFCGAVSGTFEEMYAGYRRKSQEIVHSEDQRPLDKSMNEQSMLVRRNLRHAGMMTFKDEPVRRNDAVEILKRCNSEGLGLCRTRLPHSSNDVLLELRRHAVSRGENWPPLFVHPFWHLRWHAGRSSLGEFGRHTRSGQGNARSENAAASHAHSEFPPSSYPHLSK